MPHNRKSMHLNYGCTKIIFLLSVSIALLITSGTDAKGDTSLLVNAKREDGSESLILQKVLVTSASASLVATPGEKGGQPLDPFTIFFRLKTDSGALEQKSGKDTYWRVGDEEGNPAGWIKTKAPFKTDDGELVFGPAVKEWNTRLVLDPQAIATRDKPLELLDPTSKEVMIPFRGAIDSGSGRALAFVLGEANEDEEFPCEFFIGRERSGNEPMDIQDLGIDIAFVLEMSDFMLWKWTDDGSVTGLSLLRDTVTDIVSKVSNSPKAEGRVRFASVLYQDAMGANVEAREKNPNLEPAPEAPIYADPHVLSDFDQGGSGLTSALAGTRAIPIGGDWREDGLAGISKAVNELSWRKESSKHVILIGQGAFQIFPRGEQVSDCDDDGRHPMGYNQYQKPNEYYGWSSTGKNISDIISMTQGSGKDLDAVLQRKVLHAILVGRPPETLTDPDLLRLSNEAPRWSEQEFENWLNESTSNEMAQARVDLYQIFLSRFNAKVNRARAEKEYAELSRNGLLNESLGIYDPAEPTLDGVKAAGDRLTVAVVESFEALEKSLSNETPEGKGKIAARVVEIAEAFKSQLSDKESVTVLGAPINEMGQEVAKLKLLVFRRELERLESLLDLLYSDFRPMTKRSERQDAAAVLNKLRAAVATAAAGQEFDDNTKLTDVIGDLPLRTPVLATTARAIAAMPSEDFERWLGQLEFAKKRSRDLLDNSDRWEKHTGGIGSEFGFIEQSQMP